MGAVTVCVPDGTECQIPQLADSLGALQPGWDNVGDEEDPCTPSA